MEGWLACIRCFNRSIENEYNKHNSWNCMYYMNKGIRSICSSHIVIYDMKRMHIMHLLIVSQQNGQ